MLKELSQEEIELYEMTVPELDAYIDVNNLEDTFQKYFRIRDKKGKLVFLILNKAQKVILKRFQADYNAGKPLRYIILKARQKGISTFWEAVMYWLATINELFKGTIVAQDTDASDNLFEMTKRYHDNFPLGYGFIENRNNRKELSLKEMNSVIEIQTAEGGGKVKRSDTIQAAHLTEVEWWRDTKQTLLALLQTVPDEPLTLIVLETTANGIGGPFYNRWQVAYGLGLSDDLTEEERLEYEGASDYQAIFISWLIDDEYTRPFKTPDEKEVFIKGLGNQKFNAYEDEEQILMDEYGATLEHLNWRRKIITDKCDGDVYMFHQEYPSCVTGETRVGTDLGLIRIDDAKEAEYGSLGKVLKTHIQPASTIYKVITESGYTLRGTKDHPIFINSNNETIELGELKVGQEILLHTPRLSDKYFTHKFRESCCDVEIKIDENMGRFLGYFMGDGSLSKNTLSIVCDKKDTDVIENVGGLFRTVFNLLPEERYVGSKKGGVEVRASYKRLVTYFDELGLLYRHSGGSIRRKVCVPYCIWSSPRSVVKEFLKGLFEADGFNSYKQPRIVLFSKHYEFLQDIQLLLLCFGVKSKLQTRKTVNGSGYEYDANELILSGERVERFINNIGFVSYRKQNNMPPVTNIGRKRTDSKFIDKVISVKEDGFENTYNFTIENGEAFDANGILTHNTAMEAFVTSGRPVFDIKICNNNLLFSQKLTKEGKMPLKRGDLVPVYQENDIKYRQLRAKGIDTYYDLKPFIKGILFEDNPRGDYKIYGDVSHREGEHYKFCAGADVAEGLEQGDFDCIKVMNRKCKEVVLTYHGHTDPDLLANEQHKLSVFLGNDIYFATERNNHGLTTIISAHKLGVKQYYSEDFNKGYAESTDILGFKTTGGSRTPAINDLKEWIREEEFVDYEKEFWMEALTFVKNAKGKMQAQDKDKDPGTKCFDDRIFAQLIMLRCHNWLPNYNFKPPDNEFDWLKKKIKQKKKGTTAMSK